MQRLKVKEAVTGEGDPDGYGSVGSSAPAGPELAPGRLDAGPHNETYDDPKSGEHPDPSCANRAQDVCTAT